MSSSNTSPVNGDTDRNRGGYAKIDPLELYFRDIREFKLLKREEEIELAHRIKSGDKKAFQEFVEANLRLVVKIARDYDHMGVPLLDLIMRGTLV